MGTEYAIPLFYVNKLNVNEEGCFIMSTWIFLLLFAGGCVSGMFAGLLGLGGGMLFMLVFSNYLKYTPVPVQLVPQMILANSMFAMFIGGFSGSLKHYLNRNLPVRLVLIIGFSAAIAALGVTHFFIHSNWYNKEVFTLIFILVILWVAYRVFLIKETKSADEFPENISIKILSLIGVAGGSLSALAGVGGGLVMIPMLTNILKVSIKKATSISLGVITVISFCTSLYAFLVNPSVSIPLPYCYGLILLPMTIPVTLGCLLCSPVGVALSHKLSSGQIKILYLLFLVTAIFNMVSNL